MGGVNLSDNLNQWLDAITDSSFSTSIRDSVEDDMNLWSDSVATSLALFLRASVDDDLFDWADSIETALAIFLRASVDDDLNQWQDDAEVISGVFFGQNVVVLVDIELDTGTEHVSNVPVRHPDHFYEGCVMKFGSIVRSIPVPSGGSRIADASILIADTEQKFRQLFASSAPKKRLVTIFIMPENSDFALAQLVYRGEIVNVTFPEGAVSVELADVTFDFLRLNIPDLVSTDTFDNLPANITQVFAPILIGELASVSPTTGITNCPHVDTVQNRYLVARHHIERVTAVYRKRANDNTFSLIGSGFTIVEEPITIEGVVHRFTYVQFTSSQQEPTLIRVDVLGWTEDDTFATSVEENPANNIRNYLTRIVGLSDDNSALDIQAFQDVETKTDSLSFLCAGAITTRLTHGAALSRIYSSFNIDFFQNKDGLVAIALVIDSDEERIIYDDVLRILESSVKQSLAKPVYNVIRFRYARRFADNEWAREERQLNEVDRAAIGEDIELPMDFWFVRDDVTASRVAADVAGYFDLTSYQISMDLPAPWVVPDMELAKLIGVTHYGGIAGTAGGYIDQEFKTVGLNLDLDKLTFSLTGIIRRVAPVEQSGLFEANWARNATTGPYMPRNGIFFGVFLDVRSEFADSAEFIRKLSVWKSTDWGLHWMEVDDENAPVLVQGISSFDSTWRNDDDLIEIATQEFNTGRVAYHRFDMATSLWEAVDEEVTTLVSAPQDSFVSICKTRGSPQRLCIFFASEDKVGVAAVDLRRHKSTIKQVVDGVGWSTPTQVGLDAELGDWNGNRVVAGTSNFIHHFMELKGSNLQGATELNPIDYHLTVDGNLIYGDQMVRHVGVGFPEANRYPYGLPGEEEESDGEVFIDFAKLGPFGNPFSFKYQSSDMMNVSGEIPDNIAINVIPFQGFSGFGGKGLYPMVSMFRTEDDESINAVWPGFQGGGPFSLVHKAKGENLGTEFDWDPPSVQGFDNTAGPLFVDLSDGTSPDKMSARRYTINGIDYIASFTGTLLTAAQSLKLINAGLLAAGGPNGNQFVNIFQWIQITEFPLSFDMDDLIDAIIAEA